MPDERKKSSIYDDLRALLRIFPMRHEAELRIAIALRIEIDETTKEVLGDDARERLQRVSNITRTNTFDAAISAIQEAGIFKLGRRYSNGAGGRIYQRGAAYILTRENWPTPEQAPMSKPPPSPPLNDVTHTQRGERSTVVPGERNISPPVSGGDGTALSGGDSYNDEIYDEVTASSPSLAGANSPEEEAQKTRSEDPPVSPHGNVSHTTLSPVAGVDATGVGQPRAEIKGCKPRDARGRRDHSSKGLAVLDGSDGVLFDWKSKRLILSGETNEELVLEAKEGGFDLVKALTWATTQVTKNQHAASASYAISEVRRDFEFQKEKKRAAAQGWTNKRSGSAKSRVGVTNAFR